MIRTTVVSSLIAVLLLLASPPTLSFTSQKSAGKAFDYSDQSVQKTPDWTKKPIVYDKWAQNADLAVTLDQHLYDIMLPLVQKFARDNDMDIAVNEGTCGISSGMLENKHVDIAGFCCPAGRGDRLPGLEFHTVGVAPLAIIAHKDNTVSGITAEEARGLFSGSIRNWKEVGGADMEVSPIARLHCKARPGHWRLILDTEDDFAYHLNEVGTIPDMAHEVSSNRQAVGHIATWNIHKYADKWKVKALLIDGLRPDDTGALMKGKYPFFRSYNITTWSGSNSNEKAQRLVRYLIENAGRVDSRFNMVPVSKLREAGWKFKGDELVGEPGK